MVLLSGNRDARLPQSDLPLGPRGPLDPAGAASLPAAADGGHAVSHPSVPQAGPETLLQPRPLREPDPLAAPFAAAGPADTGLRHAGAPPIPRGKLARPRPARRRHHHRHLLQHGLRDRPRRRDRDGPDRRRRTNREPRPRRPCLRLSRGGHAAAADRAPDDRASRRAPGDPRRRLAPWKLGDRRRHRPGPPDARPGARHAAGTRDLRPDRRPGAALARIPHGPRRSRPGVGRPRRHRPRAPRPHPPLRPARRRRTTRELLARLRHADPAPPARRAGGAPRRQARPDGTGAAAGARPLQRRRNGAAQPQRAR